MSSPPRKPGRPATGQKPAHSVRIADEQWTPFVEYFGDKYPAALGELMAWWVRVPGAKKPPRPPVPKPAND